MMTFRLTPNDLDKSPYKELIDELVVAWTSLNLPLSHVNDADYRRDIRTLLLTTQRIDKTTIITKTILKQAQDLHKSSDWVSQELKFEGMVEGADRADFLLFDLQQNDSIDDTLLDLYNERINRFSSQSA